MVTIRGSVNDAFTHFTALGLASIVESRAGKACVVHWSDAESVVVDYASGPLTEDEAAEHVSAHARERAEDSWVTTVRELSFSGLRAPLSPRLGRPKGREDWEELEQARLATIDQIRPSRESALDQRMLGGLGEPGYWCKDSEDEFQPDWAASALEMADRKSGREFVQYRLRKFANSTSARTVVEIADGLTGRSLNDEVGKNSLGSRTPTGLRAPSRADNAQAWCALWGLSGFPVRPISTGPASGKTKGTRSVTSAVLTKSGSAPQLIFPVPERPLTLARLRSVVIASDLVDAATIEKPSPTIRDRLARLGISLAVTFSRHTTNNLKAREHWLDAGQVIELAPTRGE